MHLLKNMADNIKIFRIKSFKVAVTASIVLHAVIITALSFSDTGTYNSVNNANSELEEEVPAKEFEVSYVNLEVENNEISELPEAPPQPSVEMQSEEPSPMELITYMTETTVLKNKSGKPRGYISGAVVENVEIAYMSVEAPPPPPPAGNGNGLYYYLIGNGGNGVGPNCPNPLVPRGISTKGNRR